MERAGGGVGQALRPVGPEGGLADEEVGEDERAGGVAPGEPVDLRERSPHGDAVVRGGELADLGDEREGAGVDVALPVDRDPRRLPVPDGGDGDEHDERPPDPSGVQRRDRRRAEQDEGGQHLEPVVAEVPEPGGDGDEPGDEPQPQVEVVTPPAATHDEQADHGVAEEEVLDRLPGPVQRPVGVAEIEEQRPVARERPVHERAERDEEPDGEDRGDGGAHDRGGEDPASPAVVPGGERRGEHPDEPGLAGEGGEAEQHPGGEGAARGAAARRDDGPARGEQRQVRVVGRLGVDRVERDGAGHEQPGGPPRGAGAGAAAHLGGQEQRGAGELEGGEHVQRLEVAAARDPEREGVEEGRDRRLAVDDVAVQDAAV